MKRIGLDISVLNDSQKTGIAIYSYELIKALLEENRQDQFILFGISTLSTRQSLKNLDLKKFPNATLKIFSLPAKTFRRTFLLWQKLNYPKIDQLIGPLDLFHSFNWFIPPQKYGKKVATVFDLTSLINPDWHDFRTTQLDKMRFSKIAQEADLVIAISEQTKKDFLKLKPKGRVEVIYPAASQLFYQKISSLKSQSILDKYHLKKGYFLFVSTVEPRKNLPFLLKAHQLSKLEIPLVVVGKIGWKSEEIIQSLQNYPLVSYLGYLQNEELAVFYQQALCLIYPSVYEGFGIPVLEAMASGTPVICSKTSSLPEVGGEAVIYINPNQPVELIRSLKKLATDAVLRKKMMIEGKKQAQLFSWKQSAQKLNCLYQDLLK